jgi:hypothetical protein
METRHLHIVALRHRPILRQIFAARGCILTIEQLLAEPGEADHQFCPMRRLQWDRLMGLQAIALRLATNRSNFLDVLLREECPVFLFPDSLVQTLFPLGTSRGERRRACAKASQYCYGSLRAVNIKSLLTHAGDQLILH